MTLYFLVLFAVAVLLFFKRKRQIGQTWDGHTLAKVEISGSPLECQVCKGCMFTKREAMMHTTFLTFFWLPFLNQSGAAYTCSSCGFIHWFQKPKETKLEFVLQNAPSNKTSVVKEEGQ